MSALPIGTLRRECLDRMLVFGGRTCDEFLLRMARTWHYRKMRRCIEPSNDLAPLSPFRYWLDCITNTSGYDFRKGQAARVNYLRRESGT